MRFRPSSSAFSLAFSCSLALALALALTSCGGPRTQIQRTDRTILLILDPHAAERPIGNAVAAAFAELTLPDSAVVEVVEDYELLQEDSIRQFSAVVLAELTIDSLPLHYRTALQRYVESGGGLLLADTAAVAPYTWHWLDRLRRDTLPATTDTLPTLAHLEAGYWEGGRIARMPAAPPLTLAQWSQDLAALTPFLLGDNTYDYARATAPLASEWSRFTRTVLDDQIVEPMEMEILPSGEVLFLERRGRMKLYDPYRKSTRVVTEWPVCTEGNYEDGLHGVALDPGYGSDNDWIYVYYSPAPCDTNYQYLSRFDFRDGELDWDSERIVLRVGVQRETCCHSGGSVEFGPDSLLYLSTGDNTSSKESDGYTPTDERPGRGPFDAQKSSANTQDLRGKILRIRPEPDGTYSIPDGNLFADSLAGRPEIYAMGCRNPFRITIDPRTNYLYWGDVGPDVGRPGRYGPQSYDEFNRATAPGNFGWPYFVADNKGYPDRNFATGAVGPLPDPLAPINDSPHNSGSRELPPARVPLFWYPYGKSPEFPPLGEGSRSAMAGPFYHRAGQWPLTEVGFPDYYENKWFIYDWARSWIKVVTFDERDQPVQIEDFWPEMPLSKPIDLKFGPDGALYVLEYGNDYFLDNPDARLVRIEYAAGNRPPLPRIVADATAGAVPFTTRLRATGSQDLDPGDSLRYEWSVGGERIGTDSIVEWTFREAGEHTVRLVATDRQGASAEATLRLLAGNEPPRVELATTANRSFYFQPAFSWPYEVRIGDAEDERGAGIDPARARVRYTYVTQPRLLADLRGGAATLPAGSLRYIEGAQLIETGDCYSCHNLETENVGPSYLAVAQRYLAEPATVSRLAAKIIEGGNGVWGERLMSAHPQVAPAAAELMVRYILSLRDEDRLPLRGQLKLSADAESAGGFVIATQYRDRGAPGAEPLTGESLTILRPPKLEAEYAADELERAYVPAGGAHRAFRQVNFRPGGRMTLRGLDLRGIRTLVLSVHAFSKGEIALYLGAASGTPVATRAVAADPEWGSWKLVTFSLPASAEWTDLQLVWTGEDGRVTDDMGHHRPADVGWLDWLEFKR